MADPVPPYLLAPIFLTPDQLGNVHANRPLPAEVGATITARTVNSSSFANGALGEHRHHEKDRMRFEIEAA
jgi:hypothetical protein